MKDLEALILGEVLESLESMNSAREAGMPLCRKVIQSASKSIRCTHRNEQSQALVLLDETKVLAAKARITLEPHPQLYFAGYLQDAEKELVEASIVFSIAFESQFETPAELGVGPVAYLHGLAEAASEMRRFLLDLMKSEKMDEADRVFESMELIYETLIQMDFPDGMTSGLRRATDALRAVLERSRSDLTSTIVQLKLLKQLRSRPDGA